MSMQGGSAASAVKIVCMSRVLHTGMLAFAQPQLCKSGPMTERATVREGGQQLVPVQQSEGLRWGLPRWERP